jgi:hypothetical protein
MKLFLLLGSAVVGTIPRGRFVEKPKIRLARMTQTSDAISEVNHESIGLNYLVNHAFNHVTLNQTVAESGFPPVEEILQENIAFHGKNDTVLQNMVNHAVNQVAAESGFPPVEEISQENHKLHGINTTEVLDVVNQAVNRDFGNHAVTESGFPPIEENSQEIVRFDGINDTDILYVVNVAINHDVVNQTAAESGFPPVEEILLENERFEGINDTELLNLLSFFPDETNEEAEITFQETSTGYYTRTTESPKTSDCSTWNCKDIWVPSALCSFANWALEWISYC